MVQSNVIIYIFLILLNMHYMFSSFFFFKGSVEKEGSGKITVEHRGNGRVTCTDVLNNFNICVERSYLQGRNNI